MSLSAENRALVERVWGAPLSVSDEQWLDNWGINALLDATRSQSHQPSERVRALVDLAAHGSREMPVGSDAWIYAITTQADALGEVGGEGSSARSQPCSAPERAVADDGGNG